MDVALKPVVAAQLFRGQDQLLHGVIGRADDPGGEEQALDVVALVELDRKGDDFLDREARSGDVRGAPVDAIGAIEQAVVRQQDFQQRHAAPVGRVGVANAVRGRAKPVLARRPFRRARRGAGRIVLGGVGQNAQLFGELFVHREQTREFMICSHIGRGRLDGSSKAACRMEKRTRSRLKKLGALRRV